ncbi:MAG: NADH-quinone oxidoreductase subunit NuoE [Myxococcales bacterium]|nr:NADH-quinone oxidoreductase subunit NuoE [Myxococcales bacterium]
MLSKLEIAEIDLEIAKFPVRKSACLDALLVVQRHRSYVSDEALRDVADYIGMSATELDGIATFYNLIYRKPVGKKVIRLCDSVSCWIMGYEKVRQCIKKELGIDWGETCKNNEYTLLPAQCLGTCDKGPAMMVNDELHTHLTPEKIIVIIKKKKNEEKDREESSHRTHEHQWSTP